MRLRLPHVVCAASVRAALVALALVSASGCSGTFLDLRADGQGDAAQPTTPELQELLAIDIATLPTTSDGADLLRGLSGVTQRARDANRVALREHRGDLVADLLVVSRAWRDVNPALSEWYLAAAGLLVAVDATEPDFAESAVERVRVDLGAAHRADVEAVVAEVRWALSLSDMPPPAGDTPRSVVLRVAHVAEGLGPWTRYGDECDGGAFAQAVAPLASEPVDAAGLDGALATEANVRTATALVAAQQAVAAVRRLDAPIAAAVDGVVADLEGRLDGAAVPLRVPTELVANDARLAPPESFMPPPAGPGAGLGFTFRRAVLVRTDGVSIMVTPHVTMVDQGPVCPAVEAGWGYPGREVLEFEGLGSIAPSSLSDGTIPALEQALDDMETWLQGQPWLPPEESVDAVGDVGVSLIADGDTYFSTLRPILTALMTIGYSPIALHTFHEDSGALDAVAVRLVPEPGVEDNLVVVREDGYLVHAWDPENLAAPHAISRVEPNPALALHRYLVEGFRDGTLDPERPLTIRVDDNSMDYGILAHLLAAVGFARPLAGIETDHGLLTAPVLTDDAGIPSVLCPAGLRLSL